MVLRRSFLMIAAMIVSQPASEARACVNPLSFARLSPELRKSDDFDKWMTGHEAQKRAYGDTRDVAGLSFSPLAEQLLAYSASASPFQIRVAGRWVAQPEARRPIGAFIGSRVRMYGELVVPRDPRSDHTAYLIGTPYTACNNARVIGITGQFTEPMAFVVIQGTVVARQSRPAGRGYEVQSAMLTDAKIAASGGDATARLFLRAHRAQR